MRLSQLLLALPGHDATRILGTPDDLKFRSSMILFTALLGAYPVFQQVLDQFFGGRPDVPTVPGIAKGRPVVGTRDARLQAPVQGSPAGNRELPVSRRQKIRS